MKLFQYFLIGSMLLLTVSVIPGYAFHITNQTGQAVDLRLSIAAILGVRWRSVNNLPHGKKVVFRTSGDCFNTTNLALKKNVEFLQIKPAGTSAWINIASKEKGLIACGNNKITIEKLSDQAYLYR